MPERLIAGDTAPDFTLKNSEGAGRQPATSGAGSTVVYFYPAASTPGCTKQACDFRDSLASLQGRLRGGGHLPRPRRQARQRSPPRKA